MSSAISPIAMLTSSGMASPGPELVFGVLFWYLLVMVVPFLVVSWRMPNTYPTGGVRRGTATQVPRDPGQPLELWRELELDGEQTLMQITGGIDYGTRRDPEHIARVLEDQGVPHEVLTAASAARRWPGVDFHGPVLFHPQAGTVDAALAVSTSHRIAKRRGAVVLDDTIVQRIDVVDDHQALVVTNHGTVRAGRVIVAAGGWEQQLLGGLVPMPDLTVTQQQVFHFPRRDITADWPVIIHQGELDTYSLPGGRDGGPLGGRKVAESLGTVTTAEGRSGIVDPAARERITDYVRKSLPGLIPEPFNETTCLYLHRARQRGLHPDPHSCRESRKSTRRPTLTLVPQSEPSAEKLALVGDDSRTCDGDSHNTRPRKCPVRGR